MKYFRMSFKEVTEERSYINILLLNASIPQYVEGKKPKKDKDGNEIKETATDFFKNIMNQKK